MPQVVTTLPVADALPASEAESDAAEAHPRFGATDVGLLFMAAIWGVNYSVVKVGLKTLEPFTFNGLRVALAAVVLIVLAAGVRNTPLPPRRDIVGLLLLGLIGNGAYQLFFIIGLARTRAGIAALVVAAGPAWIALISRLLGRERVPARGWAGIGLQLIGMSCVVISAKGIDAGPSALLGAFFIVCGSIFWALYTVLLQPYTKRVHPLHLSAITMLSGALLLVLVASPGMIALEWSRVSAPAWGAVVYAGIGALVISYLLFFRGIRILGPTRTSMYGNLQPVIALMVAWIFLGELPLVWQWVGTALIMAGLLLSRSARMQPSAIASSVEPEHS